MEKLFRIKFLARIAAALTILATATAFAAGAPATMYKVGVGESVITAPIGTPMIGYARTDVSKGVHDDLYARSLLVEGPDGTTVVMMALSLAEVNQDCVAAIREGITRQTGIPARNILLSATHTHSGPEVGGLDTPYAKTLVARSVESAVQAWNKRVPGSIVIDSTSVLELGRANRKLQWGGMHPDPEVGLIKVLDSRGKILGVAFNYGCHPSALDLHNLEFTEDWPYFTIKRIKEKLGRDVWVAYFQSAQGDIKVGYSAELSAVGAAMPVRSWWYAEVKGYQMADAVLKALPKKRTSVTGPIRNANEIFEYPLMKSFPLTVPQAEQKLAEAKQKVAELEARGDSIGKRVLDMAKVEVFLANLRLEKAKTAADTNRPLTLNLEQQAIRIGDAVFVSFPCEVFSEIGLAVKQQSPFSKTFVIGLADNPDVGYLPTFEEFKEENYEVLVSPFDPRAAQFCIDSSLSLINKLK